MDGPVAAGTLVCAIPKKVVVASLTHSTGGMNKKIFI